MTKQIMAVTQDRAKAELGMITSAYKSELIKLHSAGSISTASLRRSVEVMTAIRTAVHNLPQAEWDKYSKSINGKIV